VSGSTDGTAKLWNTTLDSAKGHRFTVPLDSTMYGPVPDGTAWITADYKAGNFQTWSLPEGRLIRTMPWKELDPEGQGFRDAMPAPGNHALYAVTTNGTIHFFNPATGAHLRSVQTGETNFTLWSISANQRWLLGMRSDEKTGLLFDLSAPSQAQYFPDFLLGTIPFVFSPDNRWLAYFTTNKVIKLCDLTANREQATLRGHRGVINTLGFSPDGKWLASGGDDGEVWLWSVNKAKPLSDTPLKGNRAGISLVVFSSDSRTLATFGADQTLRWWSVSTGQEMLLFPADPTWLTSVLDFPAPWHPGRQFLLWHDRPEQIRVTTVPSLAEIDAAEAQAKTASQSR
jgi:WD40 repeat protein